MDMGFVILVLSPALLAVAIGPYCWVVVLKFNAACEHPCSALALLAGAFLVPWALLTLSFIGSFGPPFELIANAHIVALACSAVCYGPVAFKRFIVAVCTQDGGLILTESIRSSVASLVSAALGTMLSWVFIYALIVILPGGFGCFDCYNQRVCVIAFVQTCGLWLGILMWSNTEGLLNGSGLVQFQENLVEPQALWLPADVFGYSGPAGSVVLEVRGLVNPRHHESNSLISRISDACPQLNVEPFSGQREFARIRVSLEHEAALRAVIKELARESNKRVSIKEVSGTRLFDSPRD